MRPFTEGELKACNCDYCALKAENARLIASYQCVNCGMRLEYVEGLEDENARLKEAVKAMAIVLKRIPEITDIDVRREVVRETLEQYKDVIDE